VSGSKRAITCVSMFYFLKGVPRARERTFRLPFIAALERRLRYTLISDIAHNRIGSDSALNE